MTQQDTRYIALEDKEIESRFTYHSPKGTQPERYVLLREKAKELAFLIIKNSVISREQALALTKLEECIFWVNAGIARHET